MSALHLSIPAFNATATLKPDIFCTILLMKYIYSSCSSKTGTVQIYTVQQGNIHKNIIIDFSYTELFYPFQIKKQNSDVHTKKEHSPVLFRRTFFLPTPLPLPYPLPTLSLLLPQLPTFSPTFCPLPYPTLPLPKPLPYTLPAPFLLLTLPLPLPPTLAPH